MGRGRSMRPQRSSHQRLCQHLLGVEQHGLRLWQKQQKKQTKKQQKKKKQHKIKKNKNTLLW